ncbi:MAG: hypothetical protein ACO25T_10660 [Arenimonas sp.]|uniref:hypothetical protein n=1 Tax=Arenimonas sp. TaxID=1872635 RepID=UPI003BFAFD40
MRLRIRFGESAVRYSFIELIPRTDENHLPVFDYIAEGKCLRITRREYEAIRKHPFRYYFSRELRVYHRCRREGIPVS